MMWKQRPAVTASRVVGLSILLGPPCVDITHGGYMYDGVFECARAGAEAPQRTGRREDSEDRVLRLHHGPLNGFILETHNSQRS
jgi:hypothetical protein